MHARSSLPLALVALCACRSHTPNAPAEDAATDVARIAHIDLSDASVTYGPRWQRPSIAVEQCPRCALWPTTPGQVLSYRTRDNAHVRMQFSGAQNARTASLGIFSMFAVESPTHLRFERGNTIVERRNAADEVLEDFVFLRDAMAPGARWRNAFVERDPMDVAVVRRESVTVPAGTFDALLVRYSQVLCCSSRSVSELWFAKGIGIVRAHNREGSQERTFELEAIYSQPSPDLSIDGSARPPGALRAEIRVLEPAIVGEPLPFQLLVFNATTTPVAVVPIQTLSAASEEHHQDGPPSVAIELEGGPVKYSRGYRECGFFGGWAPHRFETISPGEAFDLSTRGEASERYHLLSERTPASPGRYRARFVYDLWADTRWAAHESDEVQAIARSMPRGRFLSQWVVFDVLPPRKLGALEARDHRK